MSEVKIHRPLQEQIDSLKGKYRDDGLIPSVKNPGQPMTNDEYQDIAAKEATLAAAGYPVMSERTDAVEVTRPQLSNWRVHLMNGVVFTPKNNCEPNWFHRRMQELAFGVRWERVP